MTAKTAAERIRVRMKRTAEDIIAIGLDLNAVKERLPHGAFLPWIESEFGMSENAARNFMRVATRYGSKSANIADLTPSVLYELAAPSTPEPVRKMVQQKAEAGESMSVEEVKRLKRELADKDAVTNRAVREAEKAKREAEAEKAKASDLLEQVNMLKENADAVRIKAMFMLVVEDVGFHADHPEKLRRMVTQLADQCGKMQGVLSSLYNPRLRVVEIDGEAINA